MGVLHRVERSLAEERPAVARAARWTAQVTHQFVVSLRTLIDPITQVVHVKAHCRPPAAVEGRTGVSVAQQLVLVARTVEHTVTPDVDREAVEVNLGAAEVGFRTGGGTGGTW